MAIRRTKPTLLLLVLLTTLASAEESVGIKGFCPGIQSHELKGPLTDFCYLEGCAFSRKTASRDL
jgi:hypothetical protein